MNVFHNMPGKLQHVMNRYHSNTMQTYMTEAGLDDVGSPMLLLTLSEWCHRRNRNPSQRELAEALHITPATVAMSLKSLEQSGYIAKTVDVTDQRCKRITITEKGTDMARLCIQLYAKVDATMREGLTPEESALLDDTYLRMINNLRAVVDEPPLTMEEGTKN